MFPPAEYVGVGPEDPIRFYRYPVVGPLYRRRVELCLAELTGGRRVLEVGFGSGVAFPNLVRKYQEVHGLDLGVDVGSIADFFRDRGLQVHLKFGSVLSAPYPDSHFDSVLLVSILEHLRPEEQKRAFLECSRVLRPGGQVVYGVPSERPPMRWAFRLLGYDSRQHHLSSEVDVRRAAESVLAQVRIVSMHGPFGVPRNIYEVGHFRRPGMQA
jgi:SAM-dependent methyltransferase